MPTPASLALLELVAVRLLVVLLASGLELEDCDVGFRKVGSPVRLGMSVIELGSVRLVNRASNRFRLNVDF